ncbi:origin recognition complex subunit 3 N-terminus-domain-containing protein [Umbelopsis sp. PMI_123]|nr:origin recognition complex subunit 3 N-terminus-domain-containing protein [Umbelopsis sp. PMI_123]
MEEFDSISEGCFLVMPKSARGRPSLKKRKRSYKAINATNSRSSKMKLGDAGFQRLFDGDEPEASMQLRSESYDSSWRQMKKILDDILVETNQATFDQIEEFVTNAHIPTYSSTGTMSLPFHEIPTALVFAGINTPDHDNLFTQIASRLIDSSAQSNMNTPNYVALLQSRDCTNLRITMRNMIEQFLAADVEYDHGDDDVEEEEPEDPMELEDDAVGTKQSANDQFNLNFMKARKSRLPNYDMQILDGWYRHVVEKQSSSFSLPNLVVMIQDFESFDPSILEDLFEICSEYRSRLPIVLLIGIATSSNALHQSLSKSALSLLRTEKFWLQQSDVWFNRVIDELFIKPTHNIKLGPRPYKFLLDHFYLFDFSIGSVMASLQFTLMHHYYANPLSILSPVNDKLVNKKMLVKMQDDGHLTADHATHIRMLRSFRTHIDNICEKDPNEALRLLDDDSYLMTEALPRFLYDMNQYHSLAYAVFEIMTTVQACFPTFAGLRRSKRMLYLELLENQDGLANSDIVRWLISLVRKMDLEGLTGLLKALSELLLDRNDFDSPLWSETVSVELDYKKNVVSWMERLGMEEVDEDKQEESSDDEVKTKEEKLPDLDLGRQTKTAKRVKMYIIKKKGGELVKVANEIADWLQLIFSKYLGSFVAWPLHELVYYSSIKLHEKSFTPQPRASIQTALGQTQHYINCSCCSSKDVGSIQPTEQDTSILYKLYLECGRMINLYDWFVAFGCVIEREKGNKKVDENEVQARFIRSVAELQFLGFIKATQRKTDHVVRLTWSHA